MKSPMSLHTPIRINRVALGAALFAIASTLGAATCVVKSFAVTLPLEVIGADGYTVSVDVELPSADGKQLWMRANNLSYADKAQIQVNDQAWIGLNNQSADVKAAAKAYGGIGGGYNSLELTVPIAGTRAGQNTIRFRFSKTDGISAGYRVLAFNVLNAAGAPMIAENIFFNDEPANWQPPLNSANDIAAGESLWRTAVLRESSLANARNIQAKCADCHAQDGRDLHRFNYSNHSIVERTKFHGLSEQQGQQIASYIRSLTAKLGTPGPTCRPWNPPYQPGPGVDAGDISNWTCGAGLQFALDDDKDTLKYLFPNGVNAQSIAPQGAINLREIPIGLQLLDWKHWLPRIHPKDAWGDYFINHNLNKRYNGEGGGSENTPGLRARLQNGGNAYITGQSGDFWNDLYGWGVEWGERWAAPNGGDPGNPTIAQQELRYATAQWLAVKNWELAQEFNLETMCPEQYRARGSARVEPRSWCGHWRFVFDVSPHILKFPRGGPSMFASQAVTDYVANSWYQSHVLLNPGSKLHSVHLPTDWQYAYGLMNDLQSNSQRKEPLRRLLYIAKGTQEMDTAAGVRDVNRGWTSRDASPLDVWQGGSTGVWTGVPVDTMRAIVNGYLENWLIKSESFPEPDWQRIDGPGGSGWCGWSERRLCWRDYVPGTRRPGSDTIENFPTWTFRDIPKMRADGIDGALLNRYADLMHKFYPQGNYLSLKR
jgi:cytochrome c553